MQRDSNEMSLSLDSPLEPHFGIVELWELLLRDARTMYTQFSKVLFYIPITFEQNYVSLAVII